LLFYGNNGKAKGPQCYFVHVIPALLRHHHVRYDAILDTLMIMFLYCIVHRTKGAIVTIPSTPKNVVFCCGACSGISVFWRA